MSTPPNAVVETLDDPGRYSTPQLNNAKRIATLLNRGRLVLCEFPRL